MIKKNYSIISISFLELLVESYYLELKLIAMNPNYSHMKWLNDLSILQAIAFSFKIYWSPLHITTVEFLRFL